MRLWLLLRKNLLLRKFMVKLRLADPPGISAKIEILQEKYINEDVHGY